MTYKIISTGSKGNAVLINGNTLIDCGVPWNWMRPYVKDIRLVLLTHIHGDHFKHATARRLHFENPLLRFGCCEWMVGPLLEAGVDKRVIDVIEPTPPEASSRALIYNDLAIIAVDYIPHNVPNCAYHIFMNHEKLFYATDCSTLDGIEAKNYDLYLIEANHTKADIEARIAAKRAAGKFSYEEAAARNHLSREQAEEWLALNAGPNSRFEFLHQHKAVST